MGVPSNPGWKYGYVPSPGEWADAFSGKVDYPAPLDQGGSGATSAAGANYNTQQRAEITTASVAAKPLTIYSLRTDLAAIAVNLPLLASVNPGDWIQLLDSGFNALVNHITVNAAGSDQIYDDGVPETSMPLITNGIGCFLIASATGWRAVQSSQSASTGGGICSNGVRAVTASTTMTEGYVGYLIAITGPGLTMTLPGTGFAAGDSMVLDNVNATSTVAVSAAGIGDTSGVLNPGDSMIVVADGLGNWWKAAYSVSLTTVAQIVGNAQAASDSAYQAQASELEAAAFELQARLLLAQTFPLDFAQGTTFWTGGEGQVASPTVSANNPLPGTFPDVAGLGIVYQTESIVESCNSFGCIGVIPGIPGTVITVTAKFRAITDLTNGADMPQVGISLIPLDADYNLIVYTPGVSGPHRPPLVSDGWLTLSFTTVVPSDGTAAAYYKPSFFYNLAGPIPDPISPGNVTQGNQQFQVAYMATAITPVAALTPVTLAGSGTYTTPLNASGLRIRMVGGGGGGGGSGTSAPAVAAAGATTFGSLTAPGAGGHAAIDAGPGGTLPASGFFKLPGKPGVAGPGGFSFASAAGGGNSPFGGAGCAAEGYTGDSALNGTGSGGASAGGNTAAAPGSGGSGAYLEAVITGPAGTYAYSVGAGAAGGVAGGGGGAAGGAGGNGTIIVEPF